MLPSTVSDSHAVSTPSGPISPMEYEAVSRAEPMRPDNICVSIIKKLFLQIPFIFMIINTLSGIDNVVAAITVQTIPVQSSMVCYNYGDACLDTSKFSCDTQVWGHNVTFQCPYTTIPPYIGLMSMWAVYFVVLFFCRLWWTFPYSGNDLRLIIADEHFDVATVGICLCYVGYLFTLGSGVVGYFYILNRESRAGQSSVLLLNTSFIIGNLFSIKGQFVSTLHVPSNLDLRAQFPQPVYYSLPNRSISQLYGMALDVREVIRSLSDAALLSADGKDRLSAFGDAELLKSTLMKVVHRHD